MRPFFNLAMGWVVVVYGQRTVFGIKLRYIFGLLAAPCPGVDAGEGFRHFFCPMLFKNDFLCWVIHLFVFIIGFCHGGLIFIRRN